MSWVITGSQPFPAVIGESFGGGYFAGYISHTADGNPTHALIVAPRGTGTSGANYGTTSLAWKATNTTTAGATSTFDGAANTAAIVAAGIADHPAAQFCVNLSIGGFTDWYLPSQYEMDIAYFNLKPGATLNDPSRGINDYSVPKRTIKYTSSYPARTDLTAFNTSAQAFAPNTHWSSQDGGITSAFFFGFGDGSQYNSASFGITKAQLYNVRAFRRIAL